MALNLLRIARNDYIGQDYGGRLVSQAKKLLRAPPECGPTVTGPAFSGPAAVRPARERAGLHWPGRRADRAHHALPG